MLGALLACGFVLVVMAVRPAPADACQPDGPCTSATEMIDCSSSGSGFASFNVPKDARNLRYKIKDASSGEVYTASNPICTGGMTASDQLIPGATEDTYKVSYSNTAGVAETKTIRITAEWDRESDLGITKELTGGGDTLDAEEETTFVIKVHNYGPAETGLVNLLDFFESDTSLVKITGVRQVEGPNAHPDVNPDGKTMTGTFAGLQPGDDVQVLITVVVQGGGKITNKPRATHGGNSQRVEPVSDPHDNFPNKEFKVRPAPSSKIKFVGEFGGSGFGYIPGQGQPKSLASPSADGSATRLRAVQIAILRLGGGKPFTQLPAHPTTRAGKCKWLASKGGRFKGRKPRKRVCNSPIWIKASGTAHWRFHLRHPLPPGRYVFYSRAVGSDGVAEGTFSAKGGNRRSFRVG